MTTMTLCLHRDSRLTEMGSTWCNDCRRELADAGTILYSEDQDEDATPAVMCAACLSTKAEAGDGDCCSTLFARNLPLQAVPA